MQLGVGVEQADVGGAGRVPRRQLHAQLHHRLQRVHHGEQEAALGRRQPHCGRDGEVGRQTLRQVQAVGCLQEDGEGGGGMTVARKSGLEMLVLALYVLCR